MKIPIENKFVNEARKNGKVDKIKDVKDKNYYKQIIKKILK